MRDRDFFSTCADSAPSGFDIDSHGKPRSPYPSASCQPERRSRAKAGSSRASALTRDFNTVIVDGTGRREIGSIQAETFASHLRYAVPSTSVSVDNQRSKSRLNRYHPLEGRRLASQANDLEARAFACSTCQPLVRSTSTTRGRLAILGDGLRALRAAPRRTNWFLASCTT